MKLSSCPERRHQSCTSIAWADAAGACTSKSPTAAASAGDTASSCEKHGLAFAPDSLECLLTEAGTDEPFRLGEAGELQLDPKVAANLYTYQIEGVTWLHRLHTLRRGGILADDMGLGKVGSDGSWQWFCGRPCTCKTSQLKGFGCGFAFSTLRCGGILADDRAFGNVQQPAQSMSAETFELPSMLLIAR